MQVGEKLREKAEDSTPGVWLGHVKERKKAKDEAAPRLLPHATTTPTPCGKEQGEGRREREERENRKKAQNRH